MAAAEHEEALLHTSEPMQGAHVSSGTSSRCLANELQIPTVYCEHCTVLAWASKKAHTRDSHAQIEVF